MKKDLSKTNKKENLAMLDTRTGNLTGKITTGTKTTVNPSISNIARLYKNKDNSFILIHNHPSGCPTPSAEDKVVTNRLVQCGEIIGIEVIDHIIIGDGLYFSFKENMLI